MNSTEHRIHKALHAEAEAWPPPTMSTVPIRKRERSVSRWALTSMAAVAVVAVGAISLAFVGSTAPIAPELGAPGPPANTAEPSTTPTILDTTSATDDVTRPPIAGIETSWPQIAAAAGAEPINDDDVVRTGVLETLLVSGSGFQLATQAQDSSTAEEVGIVLYLATEFPDSEETVVCLTNYAIVDGAPAVGGTQCSASATDLLAFGFGGGGGCLPSAEAAPMLTSVWGLPDSTTTVRFEIGSERGDFVSVPVTASGTAQIVTIGQSSVWSVEFDGITSHHQTLLDQVLPTNQDINQMCGDSGAG